MFFQPGESLGSHLSQVTSSIPRPEQARSGGDCDPYHFPGIIPSSSPYGQQQLYPNPPVSMPVSTGNPFLYPPLPPLPCHKYAYVDAPGNAATSTVITHTASSLPSPGSDMQPHGGYLYLQAACHSGGSYPPSVAMSSPDPPQHGAGGLPPPAGTSHCFPVGPVPGPGPGLGVSRGKHTQKTAEAMGDRPAVLPGPPPSAPSPALSSSATSCLAKLLCSSHHGSRARQYMPVVSLAPSRMQSSCFAWGCIVILTRFSIEMLNIAKLVIVCVWLQGSQIWDLTRAGPQPKVRSRIRW